MPKGMRFSFALVFVITLVLFSTSIAQARTASRSAIVPVDNCGVAAIILYWGDNFGGDTLCLSGTGLANFTAYPAPWDHGGTLYSWNDAIGSFVASSYGCIYANVDGVALLTTFNIGDWVSYAGSAANATASSIMLTNGPGQC